jgi:hypothetical protein
MNVNHRIAAVTGLVFLGLLAAGCSRPADNHGVESLNLKAGWDASAAAAPVSITTVEAGSSYSAAAASNTLIAQQPIATIGTVPPIATLPPITIAPTYIPIPILTPCTNAQIDVTSTPPPAGGAAGHQGVVLLFHNHSAVACTMSGYAKVVGIDSHAHPAGTAANTLTGMIGGCYCATPPTLYLSPGVTVSSVVEGNIGGPGPCTAFVTMVITPPGLSSSTVIYTGVPSCGFVTHPVVTGHSGGGPA